MFSHRCESIILTHWFYQDWRSENIKVKSPLFLHLPMIFGTPHYWCGVGVRAWITLIQGNVVVFYFLGSWCLFVFGSIKVSLVSTFIWNWSSVLWNLKYSVLFFCTWKKEKKKIWALVLFLKNVSIKHNWLIQHQEHLRKESKAAWESHWWVLLLILVWFISYK